MCKSPNRRFYGLPKPKTPKHLSQTCSSRVLTIFETDPYNRVRSHPIKKLERAPSGEAQYLICIGCFRFRYDIEGRIVYFKRCLLRREDTYR